MITFAICAFFVLAAVQGIVPGQVILGHDTAGTDRFSRAVDVSGRWMIIGAPSHDHSVTDQGSAYVLKDVQGTWTENAEFLYATNPPGPAQNDGFGSSVAIDGTWAIVGVPRVPFSGTGTVIFYERTAGTWGQVSEHGPDLIGVPGHNPSQFGFSVDIDDPYAVVGDPTAKIFGTEYGTVTVFYRSGSTWQITRTFVGTPLAGFNPPQFGASVSLSSGLVAIGAPKDTRTLFEQGSVDLYSVQGFHFTQQGPLVSPLAIAYGGFGSDVADVSVGMDAQLVVGEPGGRPIGGSVTGLTHYFHTTNIGQLPSPVWSTETLSFATTETLQGFGASVALSGSTIVVGAPYDDHQALNAGAAYLFKKQGGTWTLTDALFSFSGSPTARLFGWSVAIDESETLVLVGTNSAVDAKAYTFNY